MYNDQHVHMYMYMAYPSGLYHTHCKVLRCIYRSATFCPIQETMSPSTDSRAETIPFCSWL